MAKGVNLDLAYLIYLFMDGKTTWAGTYDDLLRPLKRIAKERFCKDMTEDDFSDFIFDLMWLSDNISFGMKLSKSLDALAAYGITVEKKRRTGGTKVLKLTKNLAEGSE